MVLRCTRGMLKDREPCDYVVEYRSDVGLVEGAKLAGGYHCPKCRRFPVKMYRRMDRAV